MSEGEVEAILDTSALYPLLKMAGRESVHVLMKTAILDLTKYELGNAVWREFKSGLIGNWEELMESWLDLLMELRTLSIGGKIKDVMKVAVERDLTFYDASYVYLAETLNIKLITEDREILAKCKNAICLDDFLKEV